ncbi:DUF11 domain-containing protein [Actinokineospora terrae]|uniref:Hemolysin-type calcium-binding repeat-containing protein n=1 Tax=Actinokineospora terrae TaxID=155974 RepID=A0A1H9XP51_9PSEU|nr:DUF11 domain-containing protein [Actinokineospora terrae]SES47891.1 Hemolysin-type calcium-binding repeat-containing protein [Actinokineospora terrae]
MPIGTTRPRAAIGRRVRTLTCAVIMAAALPVVVGPPAQATFPGINGKIYFDQDDEVYSINPDGTGLTQLTDSDDLSKDPRVNADGSKVAFLRYSFSQGSNQVWVMNPDGTGATQLTSAISADSGSLAWSPAGDKLVYSPDLLTVIDADGTDPFSLGVSGGAPTWSPDGTRIAYTASGGIRAINPDGTGQTTIKNRPSPPEFLSGPSWSPDGTKIAASTYDFSTGQGGVFTINADGTGYTNISGTNTDDGAAVWSPDGTKISFHDGTGLAVMNTNGTGRTALHSGFLNNGDWAAVPAGADVSVSVTDSADPVSLGGSPYTYTVSVANAGPAGATGVSVSTTLSGANRTINSATSSQGSCTVSAPTVSCALGAVAASGSATVTISVTPSATGTITATSTVSATETDPLSGNNTAAQSTTVNNALGCAITGTPGNDTLNGGNGNDVICGLGGNDVINGGNNNDTIYAGAGDDTIDGGNSDDTIHAGDGDDVIGGGNSADYLYGEAGNDTNYGETFLGSLLYLFDNGNDHIYGGPGNDDLDGQNGNDTIVDHDGTDIMSGSNGNDTIDVLDGVGGDTANGGLGSDTCAVDGGDTATGC